MKALTIALAKGRLLEPSLAIFEALGFDLQEVRDSRKLVIEDAAHQVRFLIPKAMDVPIYVEYGAADIGIVGQDTLYESDTEVYEPMTLDYGHCRLVVAGNPAYEEAFQSEWKMLAGLRVATKYPHVTGKYFASRGLSAEIIEVFGSVELAPAVGLADVIVDVVDTGRTLKENGLVVLDEIFRSQATLIVNRASHTLRVEAVRELVQRISELQK